MHVHEIETLLRVTLGDACITQAEHTTLQPFLVIPTDHLARVCVFLHQDERLYFDYLENLTGVDYPDNNQVGVVYHIQSIVHAHRLVLKTVAARLPKDADTPAYIPIIPSVMHIWRAAEWHEREAYDLLGICFEGHTDLRRILLPEDWEGHPLRKDYTQQEYYHGIKVDYY